ncbi:MAG TPA: hypothetical protein DDW50_10740 [Firmicutes bacterium]|jgi:hypothetical protein|nr:hypothetical protein [Bacillota bacterium]
MAEFYQKMRQEIEKGISNVSIRSKEVLENMKIKKQVENLEEQIKNSQVELGQSVYTMFGESSYNQDLIAQKCEIITGLEQQLWEKKEELNQLHLETGTALGKIYCSRCKTEIADGAQYCSQCGEQAPEPETPTE